MNKKGQTMSAKQGRLVLCAVLAIAGAANAGVGINWNIIGWGAYDHTAVDLTGDGPWLLDSYSASWQLIWAGVDCANNPPDLDNGINGYVSGDDQVWAQRTIPMGGGTAPEDGTTWDNYMTGWGDTVYQDPTWATSGFVYMRLYEGMPGLGGWYYDSPLLALNLAYDYMIPFPQDFYLDSDSHGVQPNRPIESLLGASLYFTNVDMTVAFSVSNLTAGGEAQGLDSGISWQNNLTGQSGYISQSSGVWAFNCRLGVGRNEITVSGYHNIGIYDPTSGPPEAIYFSDTLTVIRRAGPQLDITNANATVDVATSNVTVSGTASNLVGTIGWTNSLGGSGLLAASASWSFTCPLLVGTNVITAIGTNAEGNVASDVLTVVRSAALGPRLNFMLDGATNLLFGIPAPYVLYAVQGADTQLNGREFGWSNLTEGVHYGTSGSNVTIQPAGLRKLIRMKLTFP
ncbi:MAG: hypothetical protein AB7V14_11560 [Kiritimatiellia bacterium]